MERRSGSSGTGPHAWGRALLFVVDIHALSSALFSDRTFRQAYPGEILLSASEGSGGDPLGPYLSGLYIAPTGGREGSASPGPTESRPSTS